MALMHPRRFFLKPRLPPELIEQIIDHLHDDKESLRTCSLVYKIWTPSARFHLFSDIRVDGPAAKLMLESFPAVIPFIRNVRLDEHQWDEIVPLLVGFESVRSLTLTALPTHCFNAQALSALFRNFSAAVNVRLDSVQVTTADELIRFICAFPCLQKLAIDCTNSHLHDFTVDMPAPSTLRPSPYLRVLELDTVCIDAVLDWYLSLRPADRPALRAVGLHTHAANNSETITRLLSVLENSLEDFLISTAIVAIGSDWPFNLPPNVRLRSLQIELDRDINDAGLVTQMLSQVSSPLIEQVGLEIDIDDVFQLGWNEIDAALQHASFSGLRTFTVRVLRWTFYERAWDHTAISWITDRMPGCRARGILRVHDIKWQSSYFLP